jgi:hypothetical protein
LFASGFKQLLPRTQLSSLTVKIQEHTKKILFYNGSEICLKSADNQDRFRGARMDFLALDEFAFYKNPDSFHDEVVLACLKPDGQMIITSTPNGHNKFYDLWTLGINGDEEYKSWRFTNHDNVPVPGIKEKVARAKAKITKDKFEREYMAEFTSISNKCIIDLDRAKHVYNFDIIYDEPLMIGCDFNTTLYWVVFQMIPKHKLPQLEQYVNEQGFELQNDVFLFHKEFKISNTTVFYQCKEVDEYLQNINWTGELHFYGDETGNRRHHNTESTTWETIQNYFPDAYLHNDKFNPEHPDRISAVNHKVLNGNNEIGVMINDLECPELIKEWEQAQWLPNKRQINKSKERRQNPIGHGFDASTYGIWYLYEEYNYSPLELILV